MPKTGEKVDKMEFFRTIQGKTGTEKHECRVQARNQYMAVANDGKNVYYFMQRKPNGSWQAIEKKTGYEILSGGTKKELASRVSNTLKLARRSVNEVIDTKVEINKNAREVPFDNPENIFWTEA